MTTRREFMTGMAVLAAASNLPAAARAQTSGDKILIIDAHGHYTMAPQ